MKILQAMAGAEHGGAEAFFMRLAPALSRAGIDQRVVIRKHDGRAESLRDAGNEPLELAFGGRFDMSTTRRLASEHQAFAMLTWRSWSGSFSFTAQAARYMMKREPSTSVTMSAALCWIAWKEPIGRPNWIRSLA